MELIHEGVSLFYDVYGEGESVVLLHGNGEDHLYFEKQIPYLQNVGYQVIVVDMRGHGASSFGQVELTFSLFANDVHVLLDHLHIEKAHILGFSDGANTAMQFAIQYPKQVASLVLYSGNLYPLGMKFSVYLAIYVEYLKQLIFHKADIESKQRLSLMLHHPHVDWDDIACVQASTLVIAGENDMIRTTHTKRIASTIPNAKLTILSEGDHFIARKQADRFNVEIHQFLEENTYGR